MRNILQICRSVSALFFLVFFFFFFFADDDDDDEDEDVCTSLFALLLWVQCRCACSRVFVPSLRDNGRYQDIKTILRLYYTACLHSPLLSGPVRDRKREKFFGDVIIASLRAMSECACK